MDGRSRIIVLASGAGTNFEALVQKSSNHYAVIALGTDDPAAPALVRARAYQVPTFVVNKAEFADKHEHDRVLSETLATFQPDFVALAGYMTIVGPHTLNRFQDRIVNIHPSLLPRFPGLNTHSRVIEAGDQLHGATVHFVTRTLDSGPIIVQGKLKVHSSDTAQTLAARVRIIEHRIYPLALWWLASRAVSLQHGRIHFEGVEPGPILFEDL